MSRIGKIYLVWRKGRGGRRIPVGEIRQSVTEGARFAYKIKEVQKAQAEGFQLYTGFPDLNKEYTENVLDIFGQRIAKSERNDLKDFYSFWNVDLKRKQDTFYMLAMTQGIIPTDTFEFLADFNPVKGLKFISEISGLSAYQIPSDTIKVEDELSFEIEPTNEYDNQAVKLFFKTIQLGYVKMIHSRIFYKSKITPIVKVHHIEKNGVLKRVFISIEL